MKKTFLFISILITTTSVCALDNYDRANYEAHVLYRGLDIGSIHH